MKPNIKNAFLKLTISTVTSLSLFSISHADEEKFGRVRDRQNDVIHVCFHENARLLVGDAFSLERNTVGTHPKGETMIRPEEVGTIRITAATSEKCAAAQLLNGTVQESDWVIRPR
ncbi:MAG: hypothetical protein J0I77_18020 [Rudaea sp.]|uniref:hypothetical protein n=1 Tax=unclassified Rudaea TaxID=2627037 RepID=UPI0010F65EE5|nr:MULTISPECIES: hypothetical protein [unclassified Rudaea]MBN8887627.1 hypothetical protein [Rudaea sp.]MBR0346655.1 hypothetical protein [Rudaea sp.]